MPTLGLIADTHGLLRQEAVAVLDGCAHILHAGDIGSAEVLEELQRIAPVIAVRGNVDQGRFRPRVEERDGVLYVNPGSAGRRRFRLPVCLARLTLNSDGLAVRLVELVTAHA